MSVRSRKRCWSSISARSANTESPVAREVPGRATRKALARIRRAKAAAERAIETSPDPDAAEAARRALTEWESEFIASVEARLDVYGSAFADPAKGAEGEALSRLQLVKLKEIEKKAAGKAPSGFRRGAGFGRKPPARSRDIHEDIEAPEPESADPPPEKPASGQPVLRVIRGGKARE